MLRGDNNVIYSPVTEPNVRCTKITSPCCRVYECFLVLRGERVVGGVDWGVGEWGGLFVRGLRCLRQQETEIGWHRTWMSAGRVGGKLT